MSVRNLPKKNIKRLVLEFIDANSFYTVGSIVDSGSYSLFELDGHTYTFAGLSDIDGEPRFLQLGCSTQVKLDRNASVIRIF